MGMIHTKCPQCWDPLPCGCSVQTERDETAAANAKYQRDRTAKELLEEQKETNRLLRQIAERK
jgi:hypothetical protein